MVDEGIKEEEDDLLAFRRRRILPNELLFWFKGRRGHDYQYDSKKDQKTLSGYERQSFQGRNFGHQIKERCLDIRKTTRPQDQICIEIATPLFARHLCKTKE